MLLLTHNIFKLKNIANKGSTFKNMQDKDKKIQTFSSHNLARSKVIMASIARFMGTTCLLLNMLLLLAVFCDCW